MQTYQSLTGLSVVLALLFSLLCTPACTPEDDLITDEDAQLEFSTDTLFFDTVFTSIGSATRYIKVYNPHDKAIRISKINLAGGTATFFNLNVDGEPGAQTDIDIAPNDSLYIFAEVTVDPDLPLSVSPFIIHDQIIFQTNGNAQTVTLEAWGQNANYIPNRHNGGEVAGYSCSNGQFIWDDPRPYVIYGVVFIDSCTLVMPAGARIHVHGGYGSFQEGDSRQYYNDGLLFIGSNAQLHVLGEPDNPVIIQGDRLESAYEDVPGQWAGIRFSPLSQGNIIQNAVIKNSITGLYVDSLASVALTHTQIYNTSGSAILGVHADNITATNCLFYNNYSGAAQIIYGGKSTFNYCTFASYGVDADALTLSNGICLDPLCSEFRVNALTASLNNCIIAGSREDEITLSDFTENDGDFNYQFNHCIVRIKDLIDENSHPDFFDNCQNCIETIPDDALFANREEDDYQLDTLSIAEEQAIPLSTITVDLLHELRDANTPDIGCYEYIYP